MEKDFDLFSINPEDKVAGSGKVLISEPFLADSFFSRSVVYMVEHNEKGSVGFILNKSLNMRVEKTIDGFGNFSSDISMGGPVAANTLHYIHTLGDMIPGSLPVEDGLFWGGDIDTIKKLCSRGVVDPGQIRFFLGYSGWNEGQLDAELAENSWVIAPISAATVMASRDEDSWKTILRGTRKRYKLWADFPESPEMN